MYLNITVVDFIWYKVPFLDDIKVLFAVFLELTVERLKQFMPQLLSRMYIEALIYGNVTKDRANQLAKTVTETLTKNSNTKALLPSQHRRYREVQLPDGRLSCHLFT